MLRIRQRFPTDNTELFNAPQEEWMSIPDIYFRNLVRSMPSIVNLVKINRGKSTKY